jgi:hypothetical protein
MESSFSHFNLNTSLTVRMDNLLAAMATSCLELPQENMAWLLNYPAPLMTPQ